jgi:hypothetical protein
MALRSVFDPQNPVPSCMIFAELTRPWSIESLLVYSLAPHPMTFAEAFGELKHVEECFAENDADTCGSCAAINGMTRTDS